jgi:transposase
MSGFIQGEDRSQATLFPERLDDYVPEDSTVRVIDVFIDELDLSGLDSGPIPTTSAGHPATQQLC